MKWVINERSDEWHWLSVTFVNGSARSGEGLGLGLGLRAEGWFKLVTLHFVSPLLLIYKNIKYLLTVLSVISSDIIYVLFVRSHVLIFYDDLI